MAEYIEREALIDKTSYIWKNGSRYRVVFFDDVILAPAADVAPVVHGHWVRQDESFTRFKCSNPECGVENCSGFEKYCPNCGAKMDEEVHNDT